LNIYEIKAYLSLLNQEPITAYKLGMLCGVPSGRIYDVMDTLMLKGLAAIEAGRPKKYIAVKPELALTALLDNKDKEWQSTKSKLTEVISKIKKRETSEAPISIIKDKDVYAWKIVELFRKADKEILTITGSMFGMKKGIPMHDEAKKALARGVKMRVILQRNMKNREMVAQLVKDGVPVREYPVKGLRLYMIDGKECLITIADDSLQDKRTTITIASIPFCESMRDIHKALWEKAKLISR